jgi:hypothetical protein
LNKLARKKRAPIAPINSAAAIFVIRIIVSAPEITPNY